MSGAYCEDLQVIFFHSMIYSLPVSCISDQPRIHLTYGVMVRESRPRAQCWKCMSQRPGCSTVWDKVSCLRLTLTVCCLTDMHTAPGNANVGAMKGPSVWLCADKPVLQRQLKIHASDSGVSCINSSLAVSGVSCCSFRCLWIREKGYNKIGLFLATMENG